ncbi:hypothetical protein R5W23_000772 [Gemmata sp. JC673]|uniref:Uncharacterized protein n=1 Tax=Gemmata algarum TaxID=2975278 RepID=A0ABU5ERT4_9BACT|nr:hypothetical protein [Gemmata algarum]MDY3558052.1 hypothetical protein [Gemmata algarum]
MSEPSATEPNAPRLPAIEPVAPADLAPAPSRRERLAWYAGTALLALVLVSAGLRIAEQDLGAPFYYDLDSLLYLPWVKSIILHGTHWHNDRLGAPAGQELYDFPVIDYLHFAFLWVLGRLTFDVFLAYNLYYLLTYPLTALTGMAVLRWLKLSLPAAAVGALLYAFLPYHQERFQYHFFLSAYWVVPLSLVPALAICKGELLLFPRGPDGARRLRPFAPGALWTLVVGALTASAGAYYAFFACAVYAFVGLYAAAVFRTWKAAAAAAWVIAPVVAVGVAYHYPTAAYQAHNGVNPITDRGPEEAELYALKLAHLVLPATDHNVAKLSRLRALYAANRPADGESGGSLGAVGGVGLVGLLALALLPRRRRWPEAPLAALVLFLVLLGTVGGLGSLFNLLVTSQIRAYARISVYIGFLCIFMSVWWADRFLLTRSGARARRLRYPALAALLVLGYFDQTPWSWNWFNPHGLAAVRSHAERFRADERFFRKVEEKCPGARVFCLPYVAYPESPPVQQVAAYEHARGYLLTDTLSWSFGAVKRRETDMWLKDVAFQPPEEFLRRIVARGFDGLFIDGRGFPRKADPARSEPASAYNPVDRVHTLYADLVRKKGLALPEVVHEDGRQYFLDLRPYRDAYRDLVGAASFERQAAQEREWIAPLYLKGFTVYDQVDDNEQVRWGSYDAHLMFVNPTDRTRRIDFSFTLGVEVDGVFHFSFSGMPGLQWPEFDVERKPGGYGHAFHNIELPPGRSTLRIRCTPPESFVPFDHRKICYSFRHLRIVEK